MGGTLYTIPLTRAPKDEAARRALLETIWGVLKGRIDALAERKGTRDITGFYLSMEGSDGMSDGSWFVDARTLMLSFGDAAGLCVGEAAAAAQDRARHPRELGRAH